MSGGILGGILGAAGSIWGSYKESQAAGQASRVQARSSRNALNLQSRQFAEARKQFLRADQRYRTARRDGEPYRQAGKQALSQYQAELSGGFKESPGYDWSVKQGEEGIVNNLGSLGLKGSGVALKGITDYRMGRANQEYGNYLNRLSGLAGVGMNANSQGNALMGNMNAQAGQFNSLGANYASNAGNTMMGTGQAQAAGYMGQSNAFNKGMQGFSNNIGGMLGANQGNSSSNSLGGDQGFDFSKLMFGF